MESLIIQVLCVIFVMRNSDSLPCWPKQFSSDSIVCVCNASYCDSVPDNTVLPHGLFALYTSSKAGQRLTKSNGSFESSRDAHDVVDGVVLTLDTAVTYQTVFGFGGALTDAAAMNIALLDPATQQQLLHSYFSSQGIRYTVLRVNMAGCDFSTHVYSYDDHEGDFSLANFRLTDEDTKYKIPYIKQAQALSNQTIRVFASPWSAPAWMKTNDRMYGKGSLKGRPGGKYYKTWADYFVKFLQEYEKQGVSMWGLTVLNEPLNGFISNFSFNCMGMSAEDERDFVVRDLGPALKQAGYSGVKLMIMDNQRFLLPLWARTVFSDPLALQYVSGIALHWYLDFLSPPKLLDDTHDLYPDKFLLATEASIGDKPWEKSVVVGSWSRGERYAHDVIQDLNHWVVGWTDWNIALDMTGGPNWAKNFVDSPILVDAKNGQFYKQPMFYALAHFSAFVMPGCQRVDITASVSSVLEFSAFLCPDNSSVVVVLNRYHWNVTATIRDRAVGDINLVVQPHSIITLVWWH